MTLRVDDYGRYEDIARLRNDGKRPSQSRKRSEHWDDLHLDLIGVIGEAAVAAEYGVRFDTSGYGAGGDSGVDVLIRGIPCAVKTNHRRNGYLLVERDRDIERVDALVLVTGSCHATEKTCDCRQRRPTTWTVNGWISVPWFRALSEEADWGYGPRRFLRANRLSKGTPSRDSLHVLQL